MTMTIKELADELGVSKQAIQKRVNNLPTNQQPTLVGGRYILSQKTADVIRSYYIVSKVIEHDNVSHQPKEKVVDNWLSEVVDGLKADKIELFNSMKEKDKQIETLQKLLDQQQVLTLQANKKITELEITLTQNEEELKEDEPQKTEPEKKSFWQRLFH